MSHNKKHIDTINSKLSRFVRKKILIEAVRGFFISAGIIFLLYLALNLVETAGRLDTTGRQILFFLFIAASMAVILFYFVKPLMKLIPLFGKPDINSTAAEVGKIFPELKDELLNALQLVNEQSSGSSPALVNAAFERVFVKAEKFEFTEAIKFSSTKKAGSYSFAIFISVLLLTVFFPALQSSAHRIINFDKDFTVPPKFYFVIQPGNKSVTKGDDVELRVKAIGEAPDVINLFIRTTEQTNFEENKLRIDSMGYFNYSISSIKSNIRYFAESGKVKSEEYRIDVVNRPVITGFEMMITPPAYSRLPMEVQKDNGTAASLKGSRISINLNSTKELSEALMIFSDSTKKRMETIEKTARISFNLNSDSDYVFSIKDKEGNSNINPITYSLSVIADEFPNLEIVSPNEDVKISDDNRLSIISKISDDFGFTKLTLNYRLAASNFAQPDSVFSAIDIPIRKNVIEDEIYYVWDLSPLVLAVDDVVAYYLELFDNDNVSGPKSVKSSLFTVRVPSMDELFAKADETQGEAEKDLVETLKETEKLREELEQLSNKLKQDSKEITWEEKEEIEKAVEKFQELEQKVEDIQESIAKMQQELQENNLLSEETMKKYMELQELMDELTNEDLKSAFEKMQEMLEKLSRNDVQQSFEDLKMNEDAFQKSLERTINLLKRIQIEQKVDELVKRTEEMQKQMEELAEETNESDLNNQNEKDALKEQQDKATEAMKKLQEEMEKLAEKMSELNDMPNEEMQKMMDEFNKQQNQQMSEQASQQLQNQQQSQAMQSQQQLSQNMQSMNQMMQQMQQQMMQQNQMQVMNDMMKILDNLLTLSREQEKLKQQSAELTPNSPQFNENAQRQSEIQRNLQKILQQMTSLSQKTFAITPEMGKALGSANSEMARAISSMQSRNGALSNQSQNLAMKHLNEAASMMKGSMQQMMQGGSGGGMMSLMQQLQKMGQQQMQINQMTKMLQEQGNLSQEQMAQLDRLKQQQQLIQKSMEQLNKEAKESGQSKKLTGNLERIIQEIKEVVSNMNTQKLNDELVQKQERILSKLLDAQRSINERDFEKQRESNTGQNIVRESPPELILNTEEGLNRLRDELIKASKEGYKKDYEDLIRKYFEALQKEKINN